MCPGVLFVNHPILQNIVFLLSHLFQTIVHKMKKRKQKKSHDDISCNMVSMCSNSMDSNLEETKNDLEDKKVSYQLYHQQVFSDNEGYDED